MQKQAFDQLIDRFSFDAKISGVDHYFQASVLVPLVLVDGAYHLLFEQRTPHIRQGGEICFPGGGIDPSDPSPLHAALRELSEELGCAGGAVRVIGRLNTQLMPHGSLIHVFLGVLSQPIGALAIASEEVASIFTVPLSFFLEHPPEVYSCKILVHPYLTDPGTGEKQILLPTEELGLPPYYSEPWGNADHKIYVYRTSHALVWGLTAKIIYELVGDIHLLQQREDPL